MEYPKFKVCCRCFTFNQAKYIVFNLMLNQISKH